MINTINKSTHTNKIRFIKLAGQIIIGTSILVLLGWLFDVLLFRSLFPTLAPMNPMAAVAFISSALSLLLSDESVFNKLSSFRKKLLAQVLALVAFIIGLLKIIYTYTGQGIEIDRLLFRQKLEIIPIGAPNRMALSTALCFILCGLALLLLNSKNKNKTNDELAQLALSMVLIIVLLSLAGYLYSISAFEGIGQFVTMSFIAAAMFVLLCIGTLSVCSDKCFLNILLSKNMGGTLTQKLWPMAIVVPLFMGWFCLELQRHFLFTYDLGIGILVVSIVIIFTVIIFQHARSLNRIDKERIEALSELVNQKKFLEAISTAIPNCIYVIDLQTSKNIYINREIAPLLGYSEETEKINGLTDLVHLVHPEDKADFCAYLDNLAGASHNDIQEIEFRIKHKNSQSQYEWWHNRALVFVRNANNKPIQILGWIQNITERKQAENKIEELLNHTQAVNEELVDSEEELRQNLANTLELNKKLSESEAMLAETQQIAHLGSWEYDIASQQSNWSEGMFYIFGLEYTNKAPEYEMYISSIHPKDREKIMEAATLAFTEAKAYELELRIVRPDTTERWLQIIGKPVVNEDGKVIKIIGITRDITESKVSEIALLDSEERYRKLVELLPDGVIVIYQEHIIYANPAALAMFASQMPEELYGKEIIELIHPDYHHLVTNYIQQGALGKDAVSLEQTLVRLDNSTFEAELSATLLNNTTKTLLILIRDITERKKSERSIAESEKFFKALFQNSSDFVQTIDAAGKVIYQSPTFYRLTGYTFEERAGKNIFELFHPDDKQAAREFLQQVAAHPGQSMVHELRILHKNGTVQWAEATVTNLLEEPVIKAFVANSRNITERKIAEEQLKDQNNELRKINAELDRFVYRASHDLRAPLASILGLITISKTETNDSIKTQYLDLMAKSINKLDVFIQSIINYSRNARLEVKGKPVDFDGLIKETFDDLRYMERNDQIDKQLHITGKVIFISDEFRLKIIFNNIISNAIRYNNPRVKSFLKINIEIDEKKVWIVFTDNGYGIAQENLDKIFDMFYRASYNNEGSGLGLYIVKEVIQTLGGTIQVTSVLGEGTTFRLNLPNQADPAINKS